MASDAGSAPLSLRPFPVVDKKPKTVSEFIARVNTTPDGFRSLSETAIKDALARGGPDITSETEDVDMTAGEDDGEPEEDPNLVRMEVLKNVDIAANSALLTLDTLSLLASKYNPTQASLTLTPQLRELVGIGTLGMDKLDESSLTPAKVADQEAVAVGCTIMEINTVRDLAEDAMDFLTKEVEAEEKYWQDIMAVKKRGWSICRMPKERHTLGVRFGFSEAAPEFKNNGLAPMRRGPKGTVQLDIGRLGGVSERIVVNYYKDGQVAGRSAIPAQTSDDAPLDARILEARNTIFSQELWHELVREARVLGAHDVRSTESRLTCPLDATSSMVVELVSLPEHASSSDELPASDLADTISTALHLLLSYAHRFNELLRVRPKPPYISHASGQQQPYTLLRAIIARVQYNDNASSCTAYVGDLVRALQAAGLASSFTLRTAQPSLPAADALSPNQLAPSQALVRTLLAPQEFNIDLVLHSGLTLTVRGRTFLSPVLTTYYHVVAGPDSPLHIVCPPYKDGYRGLRSLTEYLRTAVPRLLVHDSIPRLPAEAEWVSSLHGTAVHVADNEDSSIEFAVEDDGEAKEPRLKLGSPALDQVLTWPSESRSLDDVLKDTASKLLDS